MRGMTLKTKGSSENTGPASSKITAGEKSLETRSEVGLSGHVGQWYGKEPARL